MALGSSVKNIALTLEKVAKTVLQWGKTNAVTYDTAKMEAMIFSKSYRQRLNGQIRETKIRVGDERVMFNKEVTRWLGV